MKAQPKTSRQTEPGNLTGNRDIDSGRRVLETEAEALVELAGSLDAAFVGALNIFSAATGRITVTGMGKSGHVARKIAATMASTGTPAQFIHPAEASHGDLGMITSGDVILALSNSGETSELNDIVAYSRRFNIPLIAITAESSSSLAETSDVLLLLPANREACPMGLAPTTSTTLMLALGDALAIALLERKGFSPDDFQVFHPRGQLGTRLLKVADLMHVGGELPLIKVGALMSEALLVMTNKHFGCAGVVDDKGCLLGIVTDGDLRRNMNPDLLTQKTEAVMTAAPKTISPAGLAAEALQIMNNNKITSLFALEDNRPVGILHIHDCLRAGIA